MKKKIKSRLFKASSVTFFTLGIFAGGVSPVLADILSPEIPSSQPSVVPVGQSTATPDNQERYNSEFHRSFQNLLPDAPPLGYSAMVSQWVTTMYGFVQVDAMHDNTNSYNNWPFNAAPANQGTAKGSGPGGSASGTPLGSTLDSGRMGFDVNNSRIGFALSSPDYNGYKVRGDLEMDFLANPGETPAANGPGYYTNPIFRIRHFFMDITTPEWGNVLIGQYWSLFGWQPYNIQNNMQIAPGPGTAYGRFPQARWYKIFHMDQDWKLEPAVATMLSPELTSGVPAFTEGLKLSSSRRMAELMIGDTGKTQVPASLGISGIEQNYSGYMTGGSLGNTANASYNSWSAAGAVDLIFPIIPIKDGKPGNNLTLQSEFTYGQGDAWQFPNLSFGLGSASVGTAGILGSGNGVIMNNGFVPLDIETYNADLQYYFPDNAKTSLVLGFAVDRASNLQQIASAVGGAAIGGADSSNGLYNYLFPDTQLTFAYVDLWHDFTPAIRAGLEFGQYDALYTNGMSSLDDRIMMSWFYLF